MTDRTREERILAEPYLNQVRTNFSRARRNVEEFLEFPLTNIEALELRKIVMNTTELHRRDINNFQRDKITFSPEREAILIFLNTNYGLQIRNSDEWMAFSLTRDMDTKKFGYDPYSKSFKDMQDEMHQRFTIY